MATGFCSLIKSGQTLKQTEGRKDTSLDEFREGQLATAGEKDWTVWQHPLQPPTPHPLSPGSCVVLRQCHGLQLRKTTGPLRGNNKEMVTVAHETHKRFGNLTNFNSIPRADVPTLQGSLDSGQKMNRLCFSFGCRVDLGGTRSAGTLAL